MGLKSCLSSLTGVGVDGNHQHWIKEQFLSEAEIRRRAERAAEEAAREQRRSEIMVRSLNGTYYVALLSSTKWAGWQATSRGV